jgi:hypothetical protein
VHLTHDITTSHPPSPFISKRARSQPTESNTYYAHPQSDEEAIRRYAISSPAARKLFRTHPDTRTNTFSIESALDHIDQSESPLTKTQLDNLIYDQADKDHMFTYSEHTQLNTDRRHPFQTPTPPITAPPTPPTTNQPTTPPTKPANNTQDKNEVVEIDDDSLDDHIDDDAMSISSQPPSQNSQLVYAPQINTTNTPNNKRKQPTSPTTEETSNPNPLQYSIEYEFLEPSQITNKFCLQTPIAPFLSKRDLWTTIHENDYLPGNGMFKDTNIEENIANVHLCQIGDLIGTDYINETMPTHAIWVCLTELAFTTLQQALLEKGILNNTIHSATRLTITDNIKVLPNDNDLETTSELAILCKENCPPNQEEELYHLIKSKDDAKLRRWFQSTKGKSAHSL